MSAIDAIAGLQPKIIVTAPDGKQLWYDPGLTDSGGDTPSVLAGFKVTLGFGAAPDHADVTESVASFASSEALRLSLLPGPLGIPWLGWIVGSVVATAILIRKYK